MRGFARIWLSSAFVSKARTQDPGCRPSAAASGEKHSSPDRLEDRRKPAKRSARPGVGPQIRLPLGPFRPEHCPNLHCSFYEPRPEWKYSPWGQYYAPSCRRLIPRFRCAACGRTFTARTFSPTYWLHRCDLFGLIAKLSVAGSGIRQMARSLEVSPATVARHLTRAGRHCFLFHRNMVEEVTPTEPIAFDGFETFEHSQFFPYHLNLAAGQESWFLYHFTESPLRRKGTMTPEQKQRRQELEAIYGRPDPKAVENGILELLRTVLRLPNPSKDALDVQAAVKASLAVKEAGGLSVEMPEGKEANKELTESLTQRTAQDPFLLHSDELPAYVRAIRRLRQIPGCPPIPHLQTPSTDPRTPANPLFAVNLADLLLRHCGADHRRETIAYDERRQGGLERLAVITVWRNAIKWRRENKPGETAAMRAGILPGRITWREVFARRLFPRRPGLPGPWWEYYWRRIKTAALGSHQTENRATYAF